jgi:outer membrane lipase/esterase
MRRWNWVALVAGCAVVLAGCGGASDGADTAPKTSVSSVKVFGDSLTDSGTFGYKFTIQSSDPANPFLIFPERVAASFGFNSLCSFFKFNGTTFIPNSTCTNYAVGGGRVNNLTNTDAPSNAVPFSIPYQMAAGSASLAANDLVIIDGGSNDLADITGAFLGASSQTGIATYQAALGTLLPAATVTAIIGTPSSTSLATAGGAYAQALAQSLVAAINTNVLSKGVKKVVVVNSSDFTQTPRFQAVLAGVAAAGGTAQRDAVQGAVRAWIQAFNAGLAQGLTGTGVQVFDFYTEGNRIFADPAQYSITNDTTPACPVVAGGVDTLTGQASLSFAVTVAACNSASMSASIPVGETSPDWWKSDAFSDNFHPTPLLHQLIAQSISLQLARAGWL